MPAIEKEHVDEDASCYGKMQIKSVSTGGYEGKCEHKCRLRNECFSASVEYKEDRNRKRNIEYNDCIGSEKTLRLGDTAGRRDFIREILEEYSKGVTPDDLDRLYPAFREALSQLLFEFSETPKLIAAKAGNVLSGITQAELARRKGVTRQAVNYELRTEVKKYLRRENAGTQIPKELKGLERLVYQMCFIDGCTEWAAANALGVSQQHINRIKKKIKMREKLNGCKKSASKSTKKV